MRAHSAIKVFKRLATKLRASLCQHRQPAIITDHQNRGVPLEDELEVLKRLSL